VALNALAKERRYRNMGAVVRRRNDDNGDERVSADTTYLVFEKGATTN
jgi:hypothetical protein